MYRMSDRGCATQQASAAAVIEPCSTADTKYLMLLKSKSLPFKSINYHLRIQESEEASDTQ